MCSTLFENILYVNAFHTVSHLSIYYRCKKENWKEDKGSRWKVQIMNLRTQMNRKSKFERIFLT